MKARLLTSIVCFLVSFLVQAQSGVSISDDSTKVPDPSAILDVASNTQGVLIPRLTTTQRNAIVTPANSLLIYNTDSVRFEYFDSLATPNPIWKPIAENDRDWTISGNNLYNANTGNVGIGTPNPTEKLDVNGKTKTTNLQVTNGAAVGKILISDATGNATWENPANIDDGDWVVTPSSVYRETGDFIVGSTQKASDGNANHDSRMFFDKAKSAFRMGYVNGTNWHNDSIGQYSVAIGYGPKAKGLSSVAIGHNPHATGASAVSIGYGNTAIGDKSLAMGEGTKAVGNQSNAFGLWSEANGIRSTAIGVNSKANGDWGAVAIGSESEANGNQSISIGIKAKSDGNYSAAISTATGGNNSTVASGESSVAIGHVTEASGYRSTAIGNQSKSHGSSSVAIGTLAEAHGANSHVLGFNSSTRGEYATAIGKGARANGTYAVAISTNHPNSDSTAATGNSAIAIGYGNKAVGDKSLAMGEGTKATGNQSNAFGLWSEAIGIRSIAMGVNAKANGDWGAVAIGNSSESNGDYSVTLGRNLKAHAQSEVVVGSYNDTAVGATPTTFIATDRIFSVGNGSNNNSRSNALTILKNGNTGIGTATPTEKLEVNGKTKTTNLQVTNGAAVGKILISDANGNATWQDPASIDDGDWVVTLTSVYRETGDLIVGSTQKASDGNANHDSRMFFDKAKSAFRMGYVNGTNWHNDSIGQYSVAMGSGPKAKGNSSVAIGYGTKAIGNESTALGYYSEANQNKSSAFGNFTKANGFSSTTFGTNTIANGDYSMAMGYSANSDGVRSIAMGNSALANGNDAVAIGRLAKTNNLDAVAIGTAAEANGNGAVAYGYQAKANGYLSSSLGYLSTANGSYANAIGTGAKANGHSSFALSTNPLNGDSTAATGASAIAIGYGTKAIGERSLAIGDGTKAIGKHSTAFGVNSEANGRYSMAGGYGVKTHAQSEVVVGSYNDTAVGATPTTFIATDRIFSVGNGIDNNSRSNALTILKNGNTGIGTATPTEKLEVAGNTKLNGSLQINNAYTLPTTDGTNNQVLTTNGNGNVSWGEPVNSITNDIIPIGNANNTGIEDGTWKMTGNTLLPVTDNSNLGTAINRVQTLHLSNSIDVGSSTQLQILGTGENVLKIQSAGASNPAGLRLRSGEASGSSLLEFQSLGTAVTRKWAVWGQKTGNNDFAIEARDGGNAEIFENKFVIKNGTAGNMFLNPIAGNVGIGTTNPSEKLEVAGNTKLNGSLQINNAYTLPTTDGTNNQVLKTNGNGNVSWGASNDNDWIINGNDLYNANTGNVGIGTATPTSKLEIVDNVNSSLNSLVNNNFNGDASRSNFIAKSAGNINAQMISAPANNTEFSGLIAGRATFTNSGVSTGLNLAGRFGDIRLYTGEIEASKERMRILQNGNIGIGTPNPTQKLFVKEDQDATTGLTVQNLSNTTNSITRISASSSTATLSINAFPANSSQPNFANRSVIKSAGGTGMDLYAADLNGDIRLFTNGDQNTTKMILNKDGFLGIGTPSPSTTLDVNGTMRLRSGSGTIGQVLKSIDNLGTIQWANDNYIGNSATHTAGGNLDMNNFALTNVNGISLNNTTVTDAQSYAFNTGASIVDDANNGIQINSAKTVVNGGLKINSTTAGLLLPRMTAAEADVAVASPGMIIYVTTTNVNFVQQGFYGFVNDGSSSWRKLNL